jgi:apolipoprotein N-acyltransferase
LPPWNVWPLAWFAPTPLYVALHRARNGGVAGLNGWVFGVILFLAGAYWMLQLGSPPWAMLAFIEAVPFGIVAAFCRLVGRRPRAPGGPVVFAAAWVTGEWLRGLGRLAFPWFLLAASQVRGPRPSLQILTITGQWGLSFTIALTAAIIGEIWLEGRVMADHKPLAARLALAAGIPISLFGFGLIHPAHLPDTGAQPFVVATLQGNVTKEAIENGTADSYRALVMGTYRDMTRETAAGAVRPDLIVWPETVVPGFLLRDAGLYAGFGPRDGGAAARRNRGHRSGKQLAEHGRLLRCRRKF